MNAWKIILATMVIFGAGVVTGGLLVGHIDRLHRHREHGVPVVRPAQPGSPGGVRLDFLRRAQRELDLTPEQRERIDKILKESAERTKKIMEPVTPHLRAEVQLAKAQFLEVLTPQQRAGFEELLKQQHRAHEPRRSPAPSERPPQASPSTTALPATNP